jgi:hypothetical protein
VPSLALKPDEVDIIPRVGAPADVPPLIPNTGGWVACAAVIFAAGALPNEFVTGGAVNADELVEMPKLNMGFGSES